MVDGKWWVGGSVLASSAEFRGRLLDPGYWIIFSPCSVRLLYNAACSGSVILITLQGLTAKHSVSECTVSHLTPTVLESHLFFPPCTDVPCAHVSMCWLPDPHSIKHAKNAVTTHTHHTLISLSYHSHITLISLSYHSHITLISFSYHSHITLAHIHAHTPLTS
jgi:hypothetical protein